MKNRIVTTFLYSRDSELAKTANRIIDSIKNNAQFPSPVPAIADVEKALQEYQEALNAAGGRDRTMVLVKNNKRVVLRDLLVKLADYVNHVANNDRALLSGSGFDLSKERSTPNILSPIDNLVIEVGPPGQATARVGKVSGARAYVYQYVTELPTPATVWVSETSMQRVFTFSKLNSGVKYWFRVAAVGSGDQSVYSEPVARIIQ